VTNSSAAARLGSPKLLMAVRHLDIQVNQVSDEVQCQPDTLQNLPRKRTHSESEHNLEATSPRKRMRLSIADLLNPTEHLPSPPQTPSPVAGTTSVQTKRSNAVHDLISPPTILRHEFCRRLEKHSLAELLSDFFIDNKVSIESGINIKLKITNLKYTINTLVESIQCQCGNFVDSKEWLYVCHEKYEDSLKEAQENTHNWKSKNASEQSIAIYLILSKKILCHLKEEPFPLINPITINKIKNSRIKKHASICMLAKIIVFKAMDLKEKRVIHDLANAENNLCQDTSSDIARKSRQAKIQVLKDRQEVIFYQYIIDFFKKTTTARLSYANNYLNIALAYENLPEDNKTYPSFMRLVAASAPALLAIPADQRKFPANWAFIAESISIPIKPVELLILNICIWHDAILNMAVKLSASSS
jgi:hypothetical protein